MWYSEGCQPTCNTLHMNLELNCIFLQCKTHNPPPAYGTANTNFYLIEWKFKYQIIHDRPLYLVCCDVLSTIGETSYGIWVGFIESDIVFTVFLFIYLFVYLFIYLCIYLFVSEA